MIVDRDGNRVGRRLTEILAGKGRSDQVRLQRQTRLPLRCEECNHWEHEFVEALNTGTLPPSIPFENRPIATNKHALKQMSVSKPPTQQPTRRELGDQVETALSSVGITKERVEHWLGKPCRCPERKEKLNRLSRWAKRVLKGETQDAERHLENLIDEDGGDE